MQELHDRVAKIQRISRINTGTHAVLIGAGIGSLAAAIALSRKGIAVTVLEQSPVFSEIGAGIQISPNASRILNAFGLSASLDCFASAPTGVEMRNGKTGAMIFASELGASAAARFGAPYLNIHRADLHRVLVEAARSSGLVDLQLDARCISVSQQQRRVVATTADGRTFSGDFLVGADGIKSIVRSTLFGAEQPRFTGCVAWRGLIPRSALPGPQIPPVAALWMGPGAHFVHYFVRAGQLLNFVAVTERTGWEIESWTQRGDKQELSSSFAGWSPTIQSIIAAADPEACYKWALFDRHPMPRWSRGQMTLLGDACHATLPFMAQGACMAIEDAAVLAECVADNADIETALTRYEGLRRQRTAEVQRTSRMNKTLYHLSGPFARMRDLGAPLVAGRFAKRLERLFEYDALAAAD